MWRYLALILLTVPALAQPREASPFEQALTEKLNFEINSGLNCSSVMIDLKRKLDAAEAKLKALEPPKEEPK